MSSGRGLPVLTHSSMAASRRRSETFRNSATGPKAAGIFSKACGPKAAEFAGGVRAGIVEHPIGIDGDTADRFNNLSFRWGTDSPGGGRQDGNQTELPRRQNP